MEGFSRSLAYCQPKRKMRFEECLQRTCFYRKSSVNKKVHFFGAVKVLFLLDEFLSWLLRDFTLFFQTCITVFTPEKLPYLTTHHWLFDAVFFCPIPWENIYQTDILFSLAPLVDSHEYKSLWIKVLGKHFNSYIMNTFWVSEFRR